jgi:hypothetical protein
MGRGGQHPSHLTATAGRTARQSAVPLDQLPITELHQRVADGATRVAALGQWPEWISADSLTERIPGEHLATGFDAGVACALDMIPPDRQRLAARLHANYTPEAIAQVKQETAVWNPDSETTWWLAACAVCQEGQLSVDDFRRQLRQFTALSDRQLRLQAAQEEWREMALRYRVVDEVAIVEADGGAQAAYCRETTPLALAYAADLNLFFISTYQPSLGLEEFAWNAAVDELGRPRSGLVHGSRQFVKCADRAEADRALAQAKVHLGIDRAAASTTDGQ